MHLDRCHLRSQITNREALHQYKVDLLSKRRIYYEMRLLWSNRQYPKHGRRDNRIDPLRMAPPL